MNKPRKVCPVLTKRLRMMSVAFNISPVDGFEIFVADCSAGLCSYAREWVVVPKWAMYRAPHSTKHGKTKLYCLYYLAHECAHSLAWNAYGNVHHGPEFMYYFKQICPKELQFFEAHYKPKLAKAAGISLCSG